MKIFSFWIGVFICLTLGMGSFIPYYNYYNESSTTMMVVEHTLFGDYIAKDSIIHYDVRRPILHKGYIKAAEKKSVFVGIANKGGHSVIRYDIVIKYGNNQEYKDRVSEKVFEELLKKPYIPIQEIFFPHYSIYPIYK